MDERDNRITRTSGLNTWRAGCSGSCTSGSEGGPGKPTNRKAGRAPRSDPYNQSTDPITSRVERFQNWVMVQLSDNWMPAAVTLGTIVAGAVIFAWFRRDQRDPTSTDPGAPSH